LNAAEREALLKELRAAMNEELQSTRALGRS
jgi:hypothetical protein